MHAAHRAAVTGFSFRPAFFAALQRIALTLVNLFNLALAVGTPDFILVVTVHQFAEFGITIPAFKIDHRHDHQTSLKTYINFSIINITQAAIDSAAKTHVVFWNIQSIAAEYLL
jgi:hypothetical protein